jgi:transposase
MSPSAIAQQVSFQPLSFIGIDVGSRSISAAIGPKRVRDFRHDAAGVAEMLVWAAASCNAEVLQVVCESSGAYSSKLNYLLQQHGVGCSIVPPQRIKYHARARGCKNKTDRMDAVNILDYAIHVQPEVAPAPDPLQLALAALLSAREALKTDIRRWENRYLSLELLPGTPAEVLELARRMADTAKQEMDALEARIKQLIESDPEFKRLSALIQTIPGVGPEIAKACLARQDLFRRHGEKQLVSYVGLAPMHNQSGTSLKGRSLIGMSADPDFRQLLYMGSLSAARSNPALKEFYERLLANGKHKKLAHAAVARKLLLQIRSILHTGIPFDPSYKSKKA